MISSNDTVPYNLLRIFLFLSISAFLLQASGNVGKILDDFFRIFSFTGSRLSSVSKYLTKSIVLKYYNIKSQPLFVEDVCLKTLLVPGVLASSTTTDAKRNQIRRSFKVQQAITSVCSSNTFCSEADVSKQTGLLQASFKTSQIQIPRFAFRLRTLTLTTYGPPSCPRF